METFVWSPLFETGMPVVDGQHRQLVRLINQFGRRIADSRPALIDKTLAALAGYAAYHFASEEEIMDCEQVAAAHTDTHRTRTNWSTH